MNKRNDDSTRGNTVASLRGSLLDSSLIGQTDDKKRYNIKLINCNGYIQLYQYETIRFKKDNSLERNYDKKIIIKGKVNIASSNGNSEIRLDNALRSKLSMQRIAKANCEYFRSFFTLTIADNIGDISVANKIFNNWRTKIKRVFPEFKYICVPEFQKRGAVHYHLLSNLELNSNLITLQKGKDCMYDIAYWNYGFSSARSTQNINIVGYMSKYMTKDIDNRLFGRKRYFYSRNLIMPRIEFLDTTDEKAHNYILNLTHNMKLTYNSIYIDKYTKNEIEFKELTLYNT